MRRGIVSLLIGGASIVQAATLHVSHQPFSSIPPKRQFRTIQEAARIAAAGDRVIIHSGTYREAIVVTKNGTARKPIRFEAAPNTEVLVTGMDVIDNWRKENKDIFNAHWPYRFIGWSKTNAHPDDEYHRLIGRAEQVLVDEHALQQTLQYDQLLPGSFYVDLEKQRLYVSLRSGENINSVRVEAATRSVLWDCKGNHVHVRGIHFRYAANTAQQGAVIFEGRGDTAEDCLFEHMNGPGATFVAPNQIARDCSFQNNGQLGFGASQAHNLLISGCTSRHNNTKGFSHQWEAGGAKIVLSRGVILEKSKFLANRGPGVWFDTGCENSTVRNCLIADNDDAGIFYETSYELKAHDNVVVGNGFAPNSEGWGAQAGIVLSSSPGSEVERNLIVGNREGFNFREQPRATHRIEDSDPKHEEPIWNRDERICNNVIAYNHDAQTRGWFDVVDDRHWPSLMHQAGSHDPMSLEMLRIVMTQNIYAREDSQPLFVWGTDWRRHASYSTIPEVQEVLGLELGSRLLPITFRDIRELDFRLPGQSPVFQINCYPRGQVPEVKLGRD